MLPSQNSQVIALHVLYVLEIRSVVGPGLGSFIMGEEDGMLTRM